MRRPIAFTVFAVAGLLAVGAIVGGAVGGTMAASSSSDRYDLSHYPRSQLLTLALVALPHPLLPIRLSQIHKTH